MPFGRIHGSSPARGLTEALVLGPVLVPDPFLETEHCLQREQPEGAARAISVERQREVSEEALCRWLDQVPQAGSLRLPAELERRRVVDHQDPRQRRRSPSGLPEVGCKNGLRCDLVITEEAVGGFELCVIESFGEALT